MSRNGDYTTGNFLHHQKYYEVIGIVYQEKQIRIISTN